MMSRWSLQEKQVQFFVPKHRARMFCRCSRHKEKTGRHFLQQHGQHVGETIQKPSSHVINTDRGGNDSFRWRAALASVGEITL